MRLLVVCVFVLAVACGGPINSSNNATPTASPVPTVSVPPGAEPAVAAAKADAAGRTGTKESDWQVIELSPRDWPDTSLGCPQPGKAYAQVVTPGYLIKLAGANQRFEYHSGRANQLVFCGSSASKP